MSKNNISQQASSAILILAFVLGCSSNKKASCGSTPTAILSRPDLVGTESGFVGGFIKLRNGRECSVVLDVVSSAPLTVAQAWTSKHCHLSVEKDLNFELKIYGNSGYFHTAARAIEKLVDESLSGTFDVRTLKNFRKQFPATVFSNEGWMPGDAQADCVRGDFSQSFCATLGDTTLYELVIDPGADPALLEILEQAREKRDLVRTAASNSTGLDRQSHDFSNTVVDYWRNRKFLSFAPIVELWHVCSSPELRKKIVSFSASRQAVASVFVPQTNAPNQATLHLSGNYQAADFSLTNGPAVISVDDFLSDDSWEERALSIGEKVDPVALEESCKAAPKIFNELKVARIFGKTLWSHMQEAKIVHGDSPAADADLQAYTHHILRQEKMLREKLLKDWDALADQLLNGNNREKLYVSTNVVLNATNQTAEQKDSTANAAAQWQFSTLSMGSALLASSKAEKLPSGFRFQRDSQAPMTFTKGDSGSLFSFKNQFPLLTLNSVNGSGTSGGAAVVPTPRDPRAGAIESAPTVSSRTATESAPISQITQPQQTVTNGTATRQAQPEALDTPTRTNTMEPSTQASELEVIPRSSRRTAPTDTELQDPASQAQQQATVSWSSTSAPVPGAEPPAHAGGDDTCF